MLKFTANLTFLYNEYAFLDRFEAAAKDGFDAIEMLAPYEYPATELKSRLDAYGLKQVLFNAALGDFTKGERGLGCVVGREDDFAREVEMGLEYAAVMGNKRLHVMAGKMPDGADRARYRATLVANAARAAEMARSAGIDVLLEPINTRDMPGYFLNRQDEAQDICREIGAANLWVQFDCYHCQIVEGDVTKKLERDIARVSHVQIAGVPARNEPDTGELHYPFVFETLERLGYDGWVGCEYKPKAGTSEGLGWLRRYRGR